MRTSSYIQLLAAAAVLLASPAALAQKVYLNPSDQDTNPVSGGGNEAQYALINARIAEGILDSSGFDSRVDQDFLNAPRNANSWGANIFVSIHTNAGGGHGIETLYYAGGTTSLADKIQKGLLGKLPYASRGLKPRSDLHVLNNTNMLACLTEALFHDCSSGSGITGHPPSEASYLRSSSGQQAIGSGIAAGVCSYYGKSCSGGGTPTPTKGYLKGVVYKNNNVADHIAGATVRLNTGASLTYDGGSGWSFELDPGTYTVTASASGYSSNSRTCTVTAGTPAWCSVELTPVSTKGFIKGVVYKNGDKTDHVAPATVKTNTGATTTYDGSAVWSFEVAPGSYSITASASGYQTNTLACPDAVTAGQTAWCSVELTATPVVTKGMLKGVVYKNGSTSDHVAPATVKLNTGPTTAYNGSSDWAFELDPGSYSVTVSSAGFVSRTMHCPTAVSAGGTARCDVELTAEPAPQPDAGIPPPDAGTGTVDAGARPDAGSGSADAGGAEPDAGSEETDGGAAPQGEIPAIPDSSCGCSSGANGLLGLFALPLFLVRPRRRRSA